MHVSECFACMPVVHHMYVVPAEVSRGSDILERQWQTVVRYPVGSKNGTQVLCELRVPLLSCLPAPHCLFEGNNVWKMWSIWCLKPGPACKLFSAHLSSVTQGEWCVTQTLVQMQLLCISCFILMLCDSEINTPVSVVRSSEKLAHRFLHTQSRCFPLGSPVTMHDRRGLAFLKHFCFPCCKSLLSEFITPYINNLMLIKRCRNLPLLYWVPAGCSLPGCLCPWAVTLQGAFLFKDGFLLFSSCVSFRHVRVSAGACGGQRFGTY